MTTDEVIREEAEVVDDEFGAEFGETDDVSSDGREFEGAIDRRTGNAPPSAGLIVGSVAIASVLAFAAGTLVAGGTAGALPFIAVASIVAVVPGFALAYIVKRWIASLSAQNDEWIETAVETSCRRLGTLAGKTRLGVLR